MKPMQYVFLLVARFLCYRPRFTSQVAHVDTVAIRQVSSQSTPDCPISAFSPLLRTNAFTTEVSASLRIPTAN